VLFVDSLDFDVVFLLEFVDFLNHCRLEFSGDVLCDLFDAFEESLLAILVKKLDKTIWRKFFKAFIGEEI